MDRTQDPPHLKLLTRVLPLLDRLHDVGTERDAAGNRELHYDQYVKLVLVALANPLIVSVSALQRAAELPEVAARLDVQAFSKASFSCEGLALRNAPVVFEPGLLQDVVRELVGELRTLPPDPRLADLHHLLTIVDGTLLTALPKLARTYYRSKRVGRVTRDKDKPRNLHACAETDGEDSNRAEQTGREGPSKTGLSNDRERHAPASPALDAARTESIHRRPDASSFPSEPPHKRHGQSVMTHNRRTERQCQNLPFEKSGRSKSRAAGEGARFQNIVPIGTPVRPKLQTSRRLKSAAFPR